MFRAGKLLINVIVSPLMIAQILTNETSSSKLDLGSMQHVLNQHKDLLRSGLISRPRSDIRLL